MNERVTFNTVTWDSLSRIERIDLINKRAKERRLERKEIKGVKKKRDTSKAKKGLPFTGVAAEMFAKLPPEMQKGLL